MGDVAVINRFLFKGESEFENKNFQNLVMKDIDFKKLNKPTKFYRCDFRSAKLVNLNFYENNFDRSDFVDSYIENTCFSNCYFGTDYFNTYFFNTNFDSNHQDGCSIINCTFHKCNFTKEKFSESTLKQCKFVDCKFDDCEFSMNTLDELEFKECNLISIDFTNTTAQNFSFTDCSYSNLKVNPDYLGTYLFNKTPIKDIKYSYKGQDLIIGKHYLSSIKNLTSYYFKSERFYEFFNLTVIYNFLSNQKLPLGQLTSSVISKIQMDEHHLRRNNNLNKIIDSLIFYSTDSSISLKDYILIITTLQDISLNNFDFKNKIEYVSKVESLKLLVEEKSLSWNAKIELPSHLLGVAQLTFNTKCETQVIDLIDKYFKSVSKIYFNNNSIKTSYRILEIREGSIIVDVLSYAGAFMILATCVRSTFSNVLNTFFDYQVYSKTKELLEKSDSLNEIKKIDCFRKQSLVAPTTEITKQANVIGKAIKSFKIFVNTFNE